MPEGPPGTPADRAELLLRLAVHTGLLAPVQAGEVWHRVRGGTDLRAALVEGGAMTEDEFAALGDLGAGVLRRGAAAGLPQLMTSAPTLAVGDAASGERIGPYVLRAELGRGGMAVVYRARHEGLGREVALKVIRPGLEQDRASVARLRLEAQAAAALADHPGIVAARDVGEHEGRLYLVLDLVEGRSLEDLIDGGACTAADAARIVAVAARAVHHAHTQGILHRDLKPGNVLVHADGRAWVTDFGLAKIASLAADARTALTQAGAVLGTPAYMSPEQAAGQPLDPRSDVFSLGVTLWHACTGERPYAGESPERIVGQVAERGLPPPRARNAEVPRDLDTIVQRCCERDPARRYATAAALADDLERHGRGEAIAARPPGLVHRWRRHVRRHPAPWAAGTLVGAALALVAVVLAWQAWRVRADAAADLATARLVLPSDPEQALGILGRLRARGHAVPGLEEVHAEAVARSAAIPEQRAREQSRTLLAGAARARATLDSATGRLARAPTGEHAVDFARASEDPRAVHRRLSEEREAAYLLAWAGYQAALDVLGAHRGTPEAAAARNALCALAWSRLQEAEAACDRAAAERFERALRDVDDGAYAARLAGGGTLSLDTRPSGATVECRRYVDRDGVLVDEPVGTLGRTPLVGVPLAMGSYLLILQAPDRVPVRYPVLIERGERKVVAAPVPLLTAGEIGEGYVWVPGGTSILGGDHEAPNALPLRRAEVPGFCMSAHEVALREYRECLEDLLGRGVPPATVQAMVPRRSDQGPFFWGVRAGGIDTSRAGPLPADAPVFSITWVDADRYARWRSEREGRAVRLPTEAEWERAARGADGRLYPWGNGFHWSRTAGGLLPDGTRRRNVAPAGTTPLDRSPFGVYDLAGNLQEVCADRDPDGGPDARAIRGSAYGIADPVLFRAAFRMSLGEMAPPGARTIRLVAEPLMR